MSKLELTNPELIKPATPKTGEFYYHYKHNPELDLTNFCYLVIGTAVHTETEEVLIIYKPLYWTDFLKEKRADFFARTLSMFLEKVEVDGFLVPRFAKITDPKIIQAIQNETNLTNY